MTTIIIPALKNSQILNNTINKCLELKTNPKIIIITDDKENQIFSNHQNVKYILVSPGMNMSKKEI